MSILEKTIAVVPAYNERESIGLLLAEMKKDLPSLSVLVVNDGSKGLPSLRAREAGTVVLDLPCNPGVGGAVEAGFQYAFEQGHDYAIRCDGDGQHPLSEISNLIEGMKRFDVDLIMGCSHLSGEVYKNTIVRSCGIRGLAELLSRFAGAA